MSLGIYTVGNMVKIPDANRISCHNGDMTLTFVGKMNYEPNVVAVTYFAKRVFPALKAEFPKLRFLIVGAHPDKRVLSLTKDSNGIEVTGMVESIEPYFQTATVIVAPMLTGAGIQNKIIQAMSYGCCVATTTIGAEGLDITNGEIAILDGVDEWVSTIPRLLLDRKERMAMGKAARLYVIEHMSPYNISQQFWKFIKASGLDC